MATAVLDRLREERDEVRDAAIALAEADNFNPESESFRELERRSADLDGQIEHLAGLLQARQAADGPHGRRRSPARGCADVAGNPIMGRGFRPVRRVR
jgi:hypothetical protein